MIDSYFRAPFQAVMVDPIVVGLRKSGISPVAYTWAALLSGLTVPLFLYLGSSLWALVALLFSGYLDVIDGSLARATKKSSAGGAALDIVSDRAVEASCVLGLFLFDPDSRALYCLLMLSGILICVTSFLVVAIFTANESEKSFYYSPGIVERGEAFLFFAAMILWPSLFIALSLAFTLLVFITAFLRIYQFVST